MANKEKTKSKNEEKNKENIVAQQEIEEVSEDFFLEFVAMEAVQKSSNYGAASLNGSLRIINSSKNGKRIEISKKIVDKLELGEATSVYITKKEDGFAICKDKFFEAASRYNLRQNGSSRVIYCGPLVAEIVKMFRLDFSEKVCQTLDNIEYKRFQNRIVGIVKYTEETSEEVSEENTAEEVCEDGNEELDVSLEDGNVTEMVEE